MELLGCDIGEAEEAVHRGVRDQDLLALFRSVGAKEKWQGVQGTRVLLNPYRLMKRLQPYFERRLGKDAGRALKIRSRPGQVYEISLGTRRHRIAGIKQLTHLMLGAKEPEWKALLPARGPLPEALKGAFPLPFPPMGLNWM